MSLQNKLIGTWKSHRKRTLDNFAPYLKQKDLSRRRAASRLFGKLKLKWTKKYVYSSFKGRIDKDKYEVINESADTLVIKTEGRFPDQFGVFEETSYLIIQFEETRYHQYYSAYSSTYHYVEWFQKLKNT